MKTALLAIAFAFVASGAIASEMDHGTMDHGTMDHSKMDHSKMSDSKAEHGSMMMDHPDMDMADMMNMKGMSDVGMPAMGAKPDKVVHVILSDDMRINFKNDITIEPNDVVQFVVMNVGKIDHEFSIGSISEQLEHRAMMKKMNTIHDHESGSTVTVKPGKAKQIMWHFHGDSSIEFACNIPGHAEAGMVKSITL